LRVTAFLRAGVRFFAVFVAELVRLLVEARALFVALRDLLVLFDLGLLRFAVTLMGLLADFFD